MGSVKQQLLLTLASPSECCMHRTPVISVSLPGAEGEMCITNYHSPIITRLKPGQLSVQLSSNKDKKIYFVSGGFAVVTP